MIGKSLGSTPATRRRFLQGCLVGGGALVAASCGAGAGAAKAHSGASAPPRATPPPLPKSAKPDLPWTNQNVPPAYFTFPQPYQATAGVPGAGGPLTTVRWFTDQFNPPPPQPPGNQYWAQLNQRLGVTIQPIWASPDEATFDAKFAALAASGDLPELVLFNGTTGTPSQAQALQEKAFTDLTPYLTGSALKEYRNLSLIAPLIWNNSRINGRLYGIPRPRVVEGGNLAFRGDWATKLGYPPSQIKTTQDFQTVVNAITSKDPDGDGKQDTWGLTDIQWTIPYFLYMFRVPNNWRLNSNGTLTKDIETPEYKQALSFMRTLFKQGVFDPDAPNMTVAEHYSAFEGGKTGGYVDAPYAIGQSRRFLAEIGDTSLSILPPPGHNGQKPVMYNSPGFNGIVMIPAQTGKDERKVRQLLRIVDYYASPFGSEEMVFMQYGVEGVDYTMTATGPEQSSRGRTEVGDLYRMMTPPMVTFNGPLKGFTTEQQQAWTRTMNDNYYNTLALGISDPTLGIFSSTQVRSGPTLANKLTSSQISLVDGNTSFDSGFSDMVHAWRSQGGDQIRRELEQALHKNKNK